MARSNVSSFWKRIRDIMRNDAGINGDAQRIEQMVWLLFLKVYDAKEEEWAFDEEDYVSVIPDGYHWKEWAKPDDKGIAKTGDELLNFVNNKLLPELKKLVIPRGTPIRKSIVKTMFTDANNYMKDGVQLRQVINVIDELDFEDSESTHQFGDIYESILKEIQNAGAAGEFYTPRAVTDFMAKMINPKLGETMADFACGTGGFITSWIKTLLKDGRPKTLKEQEAFDNSIYGIEKKPFPYMLCVTNMLLHGLNNPRVYHQNSLLKDLLDYTDDDKFDVILMNPPYGGSEKKDVQSHFPDDLASSETADLFLGLIMYRLKKNGRAAVIISDGFLFGSDGAKLALKKKLLKEFNLHTIVRMPQSVFAPYTSITTNILFFDNAGPTKETWFYRLDMPEGYKHFSKTKPMLLEHFAPVEEWWADRKEIEEDGFAKAECFTKEELENLSYNFDQCGYPHEEEEVLPTDELIKQYHRKRSELDAKIDGVLNKLTEMLGIKLDEDKL